MKNESKRCSLICYTGYFWTFQNNKSEERIWWWAAVPLWRGPREWTTWM